MIGRTLTERLLATTSLAALIFAGAGEQASATTCATVGAGASYTNSAAVTCVVVNSSSISVTNTASGTIGPSDPAVNVQSSGTLSGGIINAGHITGSSTGLAVSAVSVEGLVNGGITNSGTISIAATGATFVYGAIAIGTQFGFASASSFGGGITNSGTISVNSTGAEDAQAVLIHISTFSGNISNNGTISTIVTNGNEAAGIYVDNFTAFNGSIINGGTISAAATGGNEVTAYAVYLQGSTFSGNIVNNGTITASATGAVNDSESVAATGISINVSTFMGGIVNNGVIGATATNAGCCGAAARAIVVDGGTFSGGITNAGSIIASASVVSETANAVGIYLDGGTFAGGIANSGTISAAATASGDGFPAAYAIYVNSDTFSGGMTNSGTITATATSGLGYAIAFGVDVTGGTFAGGIGNSGTISASFTAHLNGSAVGIGVLSDTFSGGISNTGSITASAVSPIGSPEAYAIELQSGTFAGGITNRGMLAATATATGDGFPNAYAIYVNNNTFSGGMTNSGTITATATTALGGGTAYGINVLNGSFTGAINNSGTITATLNAHTGGAAVGIEISAANFKGSIVNTGTIAGTTTGGHGMGIGIQLQQIAAGVQINNAGTVEGTNWAIDDHLASNAVTINQSNGLISGGTAGAIDLSSHADLLNVSGGAIAGNVVGNNANAATGNVVDFMMGSGSFSYANTISGVGAVNLQSGTLLLQNSRTTAAGGTVNTTNYTQSSSGTLAFQVTTKTGLPAASGTGSVNASGVANLAGTIEAVETASPFVPGTTYTYNNVVTAGTLSGGFSAVSTNSPLFNVGVVQTATNDSLLLSLLPPSAIPGLNSNQQSVVGAIDGIPGGNPILDQLYLLNSSQVGSALTQLSGAQYTQTNYQPLIDSWQTFTDTLSNRLSSGEGYNDPMDASYSPGSGMQLAQADIPPQVAQASDGIAGMRGPQRWGAWMRGYGLTSSAQATATTTSFTESGAGLIAGADKQMTDNLVAGVAVNISTDKASDTGGGSTLTDAYQGSAYGQYQINNDWYVNGLAGFGWQTYSSARVVSFLAPGVDNGSYNGQSYRAYGESGYTLRPAFLAPNNARVTPYLGLGYLHTHEGAFTESGPTALSVQAADQNSFTTILGARATLTWQIGTTVFQPEIRGGWQHEWLDDTGTITAAFAQAPGSTFTATGTGLGRDYFIGGAGLTTAITASTQIFLDYDAKANSSYTAQAISGGLRVDF